MKILHIITRLISGGADENTIHTIEAADTNRYQIDLVVGDGSEAASTQKITRAKIVPMPHLVREIRPWHDVIAFWQLVKLIRREKYDVIHTHTAKAGILGRLAARYAGAPVIIHSLHGATFHPTQNALVRKIYIAVEKFAARCTDHFITVGDDLRDRYLAAGIGQPEQYTTIRSGFDLSKFLLNDDEIAQKSQNIRNALGFEQNSIILGNVSRLEPRKGHKYLLESCQTILQHNTHVHLICAGEGYFRSEIEKMIHSMQLENQVHLLGFREDIADVISAMDVVVLTSLWEGLPRVLVQAAALNKPVITFAIEGATELITEGQNGHIVPLQDVELLTKHLDALVKNPQLAKKMGQANKTRNLEQWDWRDMVKRIYDLYEKFGKD